MIVATNFEITNKRSGPRGFWMEGPGTSTGPHISASPPKISNYAYRMSLAALQNFDAFTHSKFILPPIDEMFNDFKLTN